jgi:hypothetical protein
MVYLLKDTFAIKARIAAGHHGHDEHGAHGDAHAEHHEEEEHGPATIKDDEGTEVDAASSVDQAVVR